MKGKNHKNADEASLFMYTVLSLSLLPSIQVNVFLKNISLYKISYFVNMKLN